MTVKILLAASGSVSAVKVPRIALELLKFAEVRIVLTKAAQHFIQICETYDPPTWAHWQSVVDSQVVVYTDEDEWWSYKQIRSDPVVHIELRKWADLFLIAPLSANTLSKLANGLCDNLVTSVARAWDMSRPVVVAPAMNTQMWLHPFTSKHIKEIQGIGYEVIEPIVKLLACGDTGQGALAKVDTIVEIVKGLLEYDGRPKQSAEVWKIARVSPQDSKSLYGYAVSKLGTTELSLGEKHMVVSVADPATTVVFAYAIFTKGHKLVKVANLSKHDLTPVLERIDLKTYQL